MSDYETVKGYIEGDPVLWRDALAALDRLNENQMPVLQRSVQPTGGGQAAMTWDTDALKAENTRLRARIEQLEGQLDYANNVAMPSVGDAAVTQLEKAQARIEELEGERAREFDDAMRWQVIAGELRAALERMKRPPLVLDGDDATQVAAWFYAVADAALAHTDTQETEG